MLNGTMGNPQPSPYKVLGLWGRFTDCKGRGSFIEKKKEKELKRQSVPCESRVSCEEGAHEKWVLESHGSPYKQKKKGGEFFLDDEKTNTRSVGEPAEGSFTNF